MSNMIKRMRRKQALAEAHEEAKRLVLDQWDQFCDTADAVMLITLRETFGFGRERLLRFYRAFHENNDRYLKRYGEDDDMHIFAMKVRLREIGVDIDKLNREEIEQDG